MGVLCLIVGGLYVSTCNAIASDINKNIKFVNIAETAEKLNLSINSPFEEQNPIVSLDGKTMFFSRAQRPDNERSTESHEDIWFVNWNPNTQAWGKAQKFYHFNNSGANIINSLTIDNGTHTIIFGNDHAKTKIPTVELSYSKFEDKSWTEPSKFEIVTYTSYSKNDDHFVTEDGKILLTSAILEQGKKDRNLYISERVTESMWSTPIPLKGINTIGDDAAPFLLNGKYLFFSSDGLGGFGGKDIFVVKRLSDTAWDQWSAPINLGPKVNTASDDSYFHYSKVRNSAYLIRGDKNKDILELNLHLEEEVFASFDGEIACHARYFYQNEFNATSNIVESAKCYEFTVLDIDANEVEGIEFLWDFGDYTADIGMNTKHCYAKAGNYHVDFYAKDSVHTYIFNDKYSVDLEVLDDVKLELTSHRPEGGNTKTRIYTAKIDKLPEGLTEVEYYWSFGDGNYDCALTVSHEFLLEQSYQVQVTALFEFEGELVQITQSVEDQISYNS